MKEKKILLLPLLALIKEIGIYQNKTEKGGYSKNNYSNMKS